MSSSPKTSPKSRPSGLVLETYCEKWVTTESDPEDQWSADSHQESTSVHGIALSKPSQEPDVVATFTPSEGDEVYLLSAVYGTGDSFHHDSGLFFAVAVFKTPLLAEFAKAAILAAREYPMVSFFEEDGSLRRLHSPWHGYFETLERVEVKRLIVGKPS